MINIKQNRILPQIGRRLFSPPYLSRKIVLLPLLIIFTEAVLNLISQPPGYWIDYSLAQMFPAWMQQILAVHPLLYIGATLLIVGLIGLFLEGLSRTPALVLWIIVSFIYLDGIHRWINEYWIVPSTFTISTKNILSTGASIILIGFVGWILVRFLFVTSMTNKDMSRYLTIGSIGVWISLLIFGIVQSMNVPVYGWFLITPEHSPTSRVGGEIVFDSSRDKALLFGGSGEWTGAEWLYDNETWEWDGHDWTQRFPGVAPLGRGGLGMAYDASRNVIVLFGGKADGVFFDDTWEWNGETWRNVNPVNKPPAREEHNMVYDPQREQVVLYGGRDESGGFNDAWGWDGQTWQPILFETASPRADCFIMNYDPSLNRSLAFLGVNETWQWQGDHWTNLNLNGIEPKRQCSAGSAYDLSKEHIVIFGGIRDGEIIDDTWLFKNVQWQKNDLLLSASARWGHATFYDETREKVVIFGGFDGANYLNDMWELTLPAQD